MIRILLIVLLLPVFSHAQIITTVAGNDTRGKTGNNGAATVAELNQPIAITIDDPGNIYIVDAGNDDIRKVSTNGTITTFAITRSRKPHGIVADHDGNIYFTEYGNNVIRKVSPDGTSRTIAGIPGKSGYSFYGEGKSATDATLNGPNGIAIDKEGTIYFADEQNNRIRSISKDGMIATVAGTDTKGYSGDGGKAKRAQLNMPWGVATDDNGNVFFADMANHVVRKISADGIITTIAGTGRRGYTGDGKPAANATLNEPRGIAMDHSENIYIADSRNDAIRMVNAAGIVTTFAGNGRRLFHIGDEGVNQVSYIPDNGNHGDGGPATKAQLYWPYDVTVDAAGNLYIADDQNHVVRKVSRAPTPPLKNEPSKKEGPKITIPKAEADKAVALKIEIPKTVTQQKVAVPNVEMPKLRVKIAKLDIREPEVYKITTPKSESLPKAEVPEIEMAKPKAEIAQVDVIKTEPSKIEIPRIGALRKIEIPAVEMPGPNSEIARVDLLKAETPKIEEPRAEAPQKIEVPTVEMPKPMVEIAKTDLHKIESVKLGTPRTETPQKIEVPGIDMPKPRLEIPKTDIGKPQAAKIEIPPTEALMKVAVPDVEMPKPRIEISKLDLHKTEPSKIEIPRPEALTKLEVPIVDMPTPKVEISNVEMLRVKNLKTEIAKTEVNTIAIPQVEMSAEAATPEVKQPDETFNISADPDRETLTITTDSGAYAAFTITNFNGKTVIQQFISKPQTTVDISALPPAHYFINLKKGDNVKTAMFVKDK